MTQTKSWEGLNSLELRRIELRFCPPYLRVEFQKAGIIKPLARCGYMLGMIRDYIKQLITTEPSERPKSIPRNTDFALIFKKTASVISTLLSGSVGTKRPDPGDWNICRTIFKILLLGEDLNGPQNSPTERQHLARRMELYFFGSDNVVGPFFGADTLGIPQRPQEGAYHLLWLGLESLSDRQTPLITMASGGPAFLFVKDNELTTMGKAAFNAVICGVQMYLVVPKTSAASPASKSAEAFISLLQQRRSAKRGFKTLEAMASICDRAIPTCDEMDINRKVRIIYLSPDGALIESSNKAVWPAQFLNPGLRFTRVPYKAGHAGRTDRVVVVRSANQEPFSFELDDEGAESFRLWEKAFVINDSGDMQLDSSAANLISVTTSQNIKKTPSSKMSRTRATMKA